MWTSKKLNKSRLKGQRRSMIRAKYQKKRKMKAKILGLLILKG